MKVENVIILFQIVFFCNTIWKFYEAINVIIIIIISSVSQVNLNLTQTMLKFNFTWLTELMKNSSHMLHQDEQCTYINGRWFWFMAVNSQIYL